MTDKPTKDRYEIAAAIDKIICEWASNVDGAAREPELYRFTHRLLADCSPSLRDIYEAADYFNSAVLVSRLPDDALSRTLRLAVADFDLGRNAPIEGQEFVDPEDPLADRLKEQKRPVVRFAPQHLVAASDEAEAALLRDGPHEKVLAYGGRYVSIRKAPPATVAQVGADKQRNFQIVQLDDAALRERLMRAADFEIYREKSNSYAPTKVPDEIIKTLGSRGGGNAPPLVGLLKAPTIQIMPKSANIRVRRVSDAPGGAGCIAETLPGHWKGLLWRVIDRAGYDAETGLYATFSAGQFPAIETYTGPKEQARAQTDAQNAYAWIAREVLGEFSFKSEIDRVAAVAAIVTGIVRQTAGISPGFLLNAPTQSTGKTTLGRVIGLAAAGIDPGAGNWPSNEEELGKTIVSLLLSGQSVALFDNLPAGSRIESPKLARLLSSDVVQDRILGGNSAPALPANILVLLTGNNVGLEGDLASRIVEVYLDSGLERPDQRTFSREILPWVAEHRAEIVGHALTIVAAYLGTGSPDIGGKPTRFSGWDQMVRLPLLWASGVDLSEKFDRAYEMDTSLEVLKAVLATWQPAMGDEPVTVGQIFGVEREMGITRPEIAEFMAALRALVAQRRKLEMNVQALGKNLATYANRPVDGMRLTFRRCPSKKVNIWWVESVTAKGATT